MFHSKLLYNVVFFLFLKEENQTGYVNRATVSNHNPRILVIRFPGPQKTSVTDAQRGERKTTGGDDGSRAPQRMMMPSPPYAETLGY